MNLKILSSGMVVPPLWGICPRNLMPVSKWNSIKKEAKKKIGVIFSEHAPQGEGGACECCGRAFSHYPGMRPEVHELYHITWRRKESKFMRYVVLCQSCHSVCHMGNLVRLYSEGAYRDKELKMREIAARFKLCEGSGVPLYSSVVDLAKEHFGIEFNGKVKRFQEETYEKPEDWAEWHLLWEGKKYYAKSKVEGQ